MNRTPLVITGYVLAVVVASGLSIGSFVQANDWREWSPPIAVLLQIMGTLLALCAVILAYLTMVRLARDNIGDER